MGQRITKVCHGRVSLTLRPTMEFCRLSSGLAIGLPLILWGRRKREVGSTIGVPRSNYLLWGKGSRKMIELGKSEVALVMKTGRR